MEDTQKKLDKALKRNLDGQVKTAPLTSKPTSSNLSIEEPISEPEVSEEE